MMMSERKFTDVDVFQKSAFVAVIMFVIFTVIMDIIIGIVAAFSSFCGLVIFGRGVKIDK